MIGPLSLTLLRFGIHVYTHATTRTTKITYTHRRSCSPYHCSVGYRNTQTTQHAMKLKVSESSTCWKLEWTHGRRKRSTKNTSGRLSDPSYGFHFNTLNSHKKANISDEQGRSNITVCQYYTISIPTLRFLQWSQSQLLSAALHR